MSHEVLKARVVHDPATDEYLLQTVTPASALLEGHPVKDLTERLQQALDDWKNDWSSRRTPSTPPPTGAREAAPPYPDLQIIFEDSFVPLILDGTKTCTRRRWIQGEALPGQLRLASSPKYPAGFAVLEILEVRTQALREMTDADAPPEGFADLAAFRAWWIDRKKTWDPDESVQVISFALKEVIA